MTMTRPRITVAALLALTLPLLPAQEAEDAVKTAVPTPPPTTHQEAAEQVTALLQMTADCLAECTDADSVRAALPRLRALSDEAARLRRYQDILPDPTTQDYLAAQNLLKDFNIALDAIGSHIERLRKAGLLSQELRDILVIAPDDAP